ncbi:hypothetical protein [Bacillus spongiae]|uniref:hypothetical protein n=1 Tax=Bacillus spongiae TaxID=2683610 RepID=UPI003AF75982
MIFLLGFIGLLLVIIFRGSIINLVSHDNWLVCKLKTAIWFQNARFGGMFLFIINAILFFTTGLILFGLTFLTIPFLHLFIIIFAVLGSLYFWISVHKAWIGTRQGRLMLGIIGSSFYIILTIIFIYKIVTLTPSYPGEDVTMIFIGWMMAITVTGVAAIMCFFSTGFSNDPVKSQK